MKAFPLLRYFCIALLIAPAIVLAQPQPPAPPPPAPDPAQRPQRQGPFLQHLRDALDELNQSQEQRAKVDQILEDAREEMRSSMPEMRDMEPQQRREHMREQLSAVRRDVMAQLNEQQKAQFEEKLGEMRGPGFGPPPGAGPREGAVRPPVPPDAPPRPDGEQPPMMEMLRQMRQSLEQLELTPEQKQKLDAVWQETRSKMQKLREQAEQDMAQVRRESRELLEKTRAEVQNLLTPEQRQKLRELMEEARENLRPRGPARSPDAEQEQRPQRHGPGAHDGESMGPRGPGAGDGESARPRRPQQQRDMDERPQRRPRGRGAAPNAPPPPPAPQPEASAPAAAPEATGPGVGEPAPEFALEKLNGRPVQLSSFQGRVVVLVFGSYTCPAFRQRAAQLEDLRRSYGRRAEFLLIYTKEAHPQDQRELKRNRDDKIAIAQHVDVVARRAAATQAHRALGLQLEIALDDMANSTAAAYHAGPNSAFVIARDGTIVARQQWFDPWGLRPWIDHATAQPNTPADAA